MKNNPILIVSGEPYSVFIEIFLKTIIKKKFKQKIILIVSKSLFINQMNSLGFHFDINLIVKFGVKWAPGRCRRSLGQARESYRYT